MLKSFQMVVQKEEFTIDQPHNFIIDVGGHIGSETRGVRHVAINDVCFSQYLCCGHSILMEAAGFILEAFNDCQLTVSKATISDNSKDKIKVQYGKLIL